jgi:cell wall-associated NlpC family hydrolase
MNFLTAIKKPLCINLFLTAVFFSFALNINAQERERVVTDEDRTSEPTRPTARIPATPNSKNKPALTNEIVVRKKETPQDLVRKTSQSAPTTKKAVTDKNNSNPAARGFYSATTRSMMMRSIQNKIGIRYRLGTQGPNLYDCSGFVWKVFQDSGMPFTRTSAREFWRTFEPVTGDERFQFGTLVFFNRLGHVGIVADSEGFYHASTSKGVTYSKFAGYWEKRIVGYRRVPLSYIWNSRPAEDVEEK